MSGTRKEEVAKDPRLQYPHWQRHTKQVISSFAKKRVNSGRLHCQLSGGIVLSRWWHYDWFVCWDNSTNSCWLRSSLTKHVKPTWTVRPESTQRHTGGSLLISSNVFFLHTFPFRVHSDPPDITHIVSQTHTNNYFHYRLISWLFSRLIDQLFGL